MSGWSEPRWDALNAELDTLDQRLMMMLQAGRREAAARLRNRRLEVWMALKAIVEELGK